MFHTLVNNESVCTFECSESVNCVPKVNLVFSIICCVLYFTADCKQFVFTNFVNWNEGRMN